MKSKLKFLEEKPKEVLVGAKMVSLERAKEIAKEEAVEYSDDELKHVLEFVSKAISITTSHYERTKSTEAKIISINANQTSDETKSIPLYQGEHRRAG